MWIWGLEAYFVALFAYLILLFFLSLGSMTWAKSFETHGHRMNFIISYSLTWLIVAISICFKGKLVVTWYMCKKWDIFGSIIVSSCVILHNIFCMLYLSVLKIRLKQIFYYWFEKRGNIDFVVLLIYARTGRFLQVPTGDWTHKSGVRIGMTP